MRAPRIQHLLALGVVAAVLVVRPAAAQWSGLDRHDTSLRADFHTDFLLYTELLDLGYYQRSEIFVQGGAKSWGGYGSVAFSSLVLNDFDDIHNMGNLELGVLHDMDFPLMALTIHLGVTLPTAGLLDDTEQVANQGAPFGRLTDLVTTFEGKMALRIGLSARMPANLLYFRGDVGLDVLFTLWETEVDAGASDAAGAIFRANLGVGIRYKLLGGTLEYVAVAPATRQSVSFADQSFFHTLGLSLRLRTPWVRPYAAVVFPLDTASAGKIWVVSIGVGTRLD